jgi:hypothetical protein
MLYIPVAEVCTLWRIMPDSFGLTDDIGGGHGPPPFF